MPSWARRCWLSRYGYLLLAVLLSDLLGVVSSASCAVKNHVPPSFSQVEDGLEFSRCESDREKDVDVRYLVLGDVSSNYVQSNLQEGCGSNNLYRNLEQFCFQSTLPTFSVKKENPGVALSSEASQHQSGNFLLSGRSDMPGENNLSMSFDNFSFKLLNGRVITCSVSSMFDPLEIENVDSLEIASSGRSHGGKCGDAFGRTSPASSDNDLDRVGLGTFASVRAAGVVVHPPVLDWGVNYLLSPSVSYLTVSNAHNESIICVHEPFSTDPQFYVYDFEERMLAPGEAISISFIFLPRLLGSSSSKLILQTSAGGFIIHAKGEAMESPYRVHPMVFQYVLAERSSPKKLSLYNPFDVNLYVGEITAWFSVIIGNATHSAHAACQKIEDDDSFSSHLNDKDWITVRSFPLGLPLLQVRPSSLWEISPGKSENIIELDSLLPTEGGIFGAICVSLWNLSHEEVQKIVVPFEAEILGRVIYTNCKGSLCVLLESLVMHDGEESRMFSVSLKNDASHLVKVTEVREVTEGEKYFQIKYVRGLILFSQTVTRIANVIFVPHTSSENVVNEVPMIGSNCKLLIVTNDSISQQIEIPCEVIFDALSGHQLKATTSAFGGNLHGIIDGERSALASSRPQTFSILTQPQSLMKGSHISEADEWILNNWRSQRTAIGMSVLDDLEIVFPIVQVGEHCSKWITVKNPSQKPVVMQLVLNSGVIIDQCIGPDDLSQHAATSSSTKYEASTKDEGFYMSVGGTAEAFVYPNESALLGPISYRPSNRCIWRSSALIRNNLTGVEWLPLHGSGGLASLTLFEGSKPVQSLEFDFGYPLSLNTSPPERLLDIKSTSATCTRPLLKLLHAKNTGEVPLEVKRIDISGTYCGSDGFTVDTCAGFALQPGESMRLLISYQTDFSASVVHRDLELALSTGVLVIPMRATFPAYMLSLCRRSFFWMLLRKVSLVVLAAASATFLVFCCILPQATVSEGDGCLCKDVKRTISSVARIDKQAHSHQSQGSFRLTTTHPTSDMCQKDTYKSEESETISSQHLRWLQDNVLTSLSLQSYNEDHKRIQSSRSNCTVENSGLTESPKVTNLTVKTERERGKRRKRRGGVLAGKHEVSSSQSGNSTPSSPVSPLTPFISSCPGSPLVRGSSMPLTPHVGEVEASAYSLAITDYGDVTSKPVKFRGNNLLSSKQMTECTTAEVPCLDKSRKRSGHPVLLPSATFPTSGKHDVRNACIPSMLASSPSSPCLSQPSAIAPHARAPGSRLEKERTCKQENESDISSRDEGRIYDIWGNHFPEFQLMHSPVLCYSRMSDTSPDSQSFFAQTPQSHLLKSSY